jgi:hypothetical protein
MKKLLIVEIFVSVALMSMGLVTAGNMFGNDDVASESDNICNNGYNCICDGQCNAKQCFNQYMNGKCLRNNNCDGCCKMN